MDRDRIELIADEARAGFRFAPKVITELCDELLKLEWRPITAEDLPQVGDEVLWAGVHAYSVNEPRHLFAWQMGGYTLFRSLNLPNVVDLAKEQE